MWTRIREIASRVCARKHRCIEFTQWSKPFHDGYGRMWQDRKCTICSARQERALKTWHR